MRTSSLITVVAAASCAAAAPVAQVTQPEQGPKKFEVSNFVYGCTSGCYWSFDLDIKNFGQQFALPDAPAKCQGSLEDTTFVSCNTNSSKTYDLAAYIEKSNNELHLQYTLYDYANSQAYYYDGQAQTYAATNDPEHKQQSNFCVPVTSESSGPFDNSDN